MKLSSFVVSMLFVLLLAACASVQNVSLDKTSRAPIRSVALLKVGEPQMVQVTGDLMAGMGAAVLLGPTAGTAFQESLDRKRAKQFLQAVNDRNIKFSDVMVSRIQAGLAQSGIQVEYFPDKTPKIAPDGKSDDYSEVTTDKDAILHVWFGDMGFVNTAKLKLSTRFQPWLIVNARIVDPKTRAIIYQKTFNVGVNAKIANAVFLSLDPKYQFGSFGDLMSRVDFGIESLTSGEALVASRIVMDIK